MARAHEDVLEAILESQNSYEFTILKISEPIAGPLKENPGERTSDVSADVFENPTPASLEADLAHYKVYTPLHEELLPLNASIGTIFKASIFIPRTSNERKVYTRDRWRPASSC